MCGKMVGWENVKSEGGKGSGGGGEDKKLWYRVGIFFTEMVNVKGFHVAQFEEF